MPNNEVSEDDKRLIFLLFDEKPKVKAEIGAAEKKLEALRETSKSLSMRGIAEKFGRCNRTISLLYREYLDQL